MYKYIYIYIYIYIKKYRKYLCMNIYIYISKHIYIYIKQYTVNLIKTLKTTVRNTKHQQQPSVWKVRSQTHASALRRSQSPRMPNKPPLVLRRAWAPSVALRIKKHQDKYSSKGLSKGLSKCSIFLNPIKGK